MTYNALSEHSYYRDLTLRLRGSSPAANERLERHAKEIMIETRERDLRALRPAGAEYEVRVPANWTPGTGGDFAPPLWLNEAFATQPPAEACARGVRPELPAPAGSTGHPAPAALTKGTKNWRPAGSARRCPGQDITDAEVNTPRCARSAGRARCAARDARAEPARRITRLGSLQGPPGGLRRAARGTAPRRHRRRHTDSRPDERQRHQQDHLHLDASPTGSELFVFLGNAAAQMGDNRRLPPEMWLMRTARWAFIGTASEAQTGLPLAVPGHHDRLRRSLPVRRQQAVRCQRRAPDGRSTPTTRSPSPKAPTSSSPARPPTLMVLESEPRARHHARAALRRDGRPAIRRCPTSPECTGRYPTGISVIEGTGMTVPVGD